MSWRVRLLHEGPPFSPLYIEVDCWVVCNDLILHDLKNQSLLVLGWLLLPSPETPARLLIMALATVEGPDCPLSQ